MFDTFMSKFSALGSTQGRAPTVSQSGTYKQLDYGDSNASRSGRYGEGLKTRRHYDMCMVFKYKTDKFVRYPADAEDNDHMVGEDLEGGRQLKEASDADKNKMRMWKSRRTSIMKTLQNCGLHVYSFYNRDRDEIIVKIGASADKLRNTAAMMKYKLPLKAEYLSAYAEYRHDFAGRPELQFTDRRVVSHIYKQHGAEDDFSSDDSMFTTVDRIHIVHHIITSTDKECAGINVGMLQHGEPLTEESASKFFSPPNEPLLISYFPLHEDHQLAELKRASNLSWFMMNGEFTTTVREYYGDKIAYYFLWQSFYWKWLILIGFVGFAKQINDLFFRTPDNWSALPFCVLLAVWSTFLPHFWRRQEAKFAISWGRLNEIETLEQCRPEHWGEPRINPVTARIEPHYPFAKRLSRYLLSYTVVLCAGASVVFVAIALLMLRHHHKQNIAGGVLAFQFILAITVELMNQFLSFIGATLTRFENHRTQSEHETHQLAKIMVFKFVNSYFALYYITFFKTHAPAFFGTGLMCMQDDCMLDLQSQLGVFVVFRLVIQNLLEYGMPRVKMMYRSWYFGGRSILSLITGPASFGRIELAALSGAENQAKMEKYNTFDDFDEALVTHGYATLFAVAAPWVCGATLFATLLETYIDKKSLTETKQRTFPRKCSSNDPWSTAFTLYGMMAAFTNVFLVIFAAEHAEFAMMTFTEKLVLFLFVEKLVLIAHITLRYALPTVPRTVSLLQLKQADMVHRCLENIKVEPTQDYKMFANASSKVEFDVLERDYMEEDEDEPQIDLSNAHKDVMGHTMQILKDEKKKFGEMLYAPIAACSQSKTPAATPAASRASRETSS